VKRTSLFALLLVLVSACASIEKLGSAVRISNVSQGLARIESSGEWKIYAEGSNFKHEVNGNCVADGKTTPCMWFAVAFDYSADADIAVLTCKGTFSEPTDVVTPKEVIALKAREHTSEVELRGRTGRAFWQGYSIADGDTKPNTTSVTCEHNGKSVLSYEFTITEQPNPTVERDARKSGARSSP
jgi:hypothetical protein